MGGAEQGRRGIVDEIRDVTGGQLTSDPEIL